jgi:hypothetical protein
MLIRVGRRRDKDSYYIGRPSPLGNPFILTDESNRDIVCDMYAEWLEEKVHSKDSKVLAELRKIKKLAERQEGVVLGCYCSPKRCHGDEIKKLMEKLDDDKHVLL